MPGDTPNCQSCGDNDLPDGSDCSGGSSSLGCHNPCGTGNTATCEILPSQISNFTLQFFGPITKTDDGMGNVTWQLPCGLDVGLPSNPRAVGEGLACYFLRLFSGVVAANQGPPGPQGPPGLNGQDAFTVTTQNFNQPTLSAPVVQIITVPNTLFVAGLNIFVQNSGYYVINQVGSGGVLFLTLVKPVSAPPPLVAAGALVVPAGPPGVSVPGPQGIQGFTGPIGPVGPVGPIGQPGPAFPVTFTQYIPPNGAPNAGVPATFGSIAFGTNLAQVILGSAGTYILYFSTTVVAGGSGAPLQFKVRNISTSSDASGSIIQVGTSQYTTIPVVGTILFQTTGPNNQIQLWGQVTGGGIFLTASAFNMTVLRIA